MAAFGLGPASRGDREGIPHPVRDSCFQVATDQFRGRTARKHRAIGIGLGLEQAGRIPGNILGP